MDVVFLEDTMYFSEPEFQGEYRKKIQTLDYGENNQDVVNLDSSDITLCQSDDDTQIGQNQEMGELNLSGTLNQSDDAHPIIEEVGLSPAQPEIEILKNMAPPLFDIPHQSVAPASHQRYP